MKGYGIAADDEEINLGRVQQRAKIAKVFVKLRLGLLH